MTERGIAVVEPSATGGVGAMGMLILVESLRRAGYPAERVRFSREGAEQLDMFGAPSHATDARSLPAAPLAWFVSVLYPRQYLEIADMFARMRVAPRSVDRAPGDPLVAFGGQAMIAPAPLADFADVIALGDGEATGRVLAEAVIGGRSRLEIMRDVAGRPGFWVPSMDDGTHRLVRLETPTHTPLVVLPGSTGRGAPIIEAARGCASRCAFCPIGWAGGTYREAEPGTVERIIREHAGRQVNVFAPDLSSVSSIDGIERTLTEAGCSNKGRDARIDRTAKLLDSGAIDGVKGWSFGVEGLSARLRAAIGKPLEDDAILETMRKLEGVARDVRWYLLLGLPGESDRDLDDLIALLSRMVDIYTGRLDITISILQPVPHTPLERVSGRWDRAAYDRGLKLIAWCSAVWKDKGRQWLVSNPKGIELHESDTALQRAGRETGAYLATARPSDVASGRWRKGVDQRLLDPLTWDEPAAWDFVDTGIPRSKVRVAWRSYWSRLGEPEPAP